jgi:hypothetical protein
LTDLTEKKGRYRSRLSAGSIEAQVADDRAVFECVGDFY